MCYLQKTHIMCKNSCRLKMNGSKLFHANANCKKAIALIISDIADFKPKIIRDKTPYITIRESIQQEDTIFKNTYAPKM